MKWPLKYGLAFLPAIVLAASLAAQPANVAAPTTALPLPVEEWSKTDRGLQARLLLSRPNDKTDNLNAFLQFQNTTGQEISLSTHPLLEWRLTDAAGHDIPSGSGIRGGGGSGGEWHEQWASLLPGGMRLSLRIRPNGGFAAVPGTRILALQTTSWDFAARDAAVWALAPGEYSLHGTVISQKKGAGPANQWVGKLDLPPVPFRIDTR